MKIKFCLNFIAMVSSLGLIAVAHADDQPAALSVADIIRQSQAKYAALTSYSDEGSTVATLGATTASSYTFTIALARTNLYQVVWRQADQFYLPKGVVWSAGDGDFLWMGKNFKPQKYADKETALAGATGISGGAAASIPGTFFRLNWGNQLGGALAGGQRKADEKIGDVDCYVLTHSSSGRTNFLWIGKQDLLIHQVENDTSGAAMKTVLEAQAKKNPQIRTMLDTAGAQLFQDSRSVETHENIRVNPPLTQADFEFKAPSTATP